MTTNAVDLLIKLVAQYGHVDNAAYSRLLSEAERWLKRNHAESLKQAKAEQD